MAVEVYRSGLPRPWNYGVCRDGRMFFINEESRSTTWLHPVWNHPVQTGHISTRDLPKGWETDFSPDGVVYFIDHTNLRTTFTNPITKESSAEAKNQVEDQGGFIGGTDSRQGFKRGSSRRKSAKQKVLDKTPSAPRSVHAPVTLRGFLYKQESGGLKSWKKKWFVLSDFCLYYYKTSDEGQSLGSILLPSYKIKFCDKEDGISRKHAFKAEHQNMRTYYFAAETQEEQTQWMDAMRLATVLQTRPEDLVDKRDSFGHPDLNQNTERGGFESWPTAASNSIPRRQVTEAEQHSPSSTIPIGGEAENMSSNSSRSGSGPERRQGPGSGSRPQSKEVPPARDPQRLAGAVHLGYGDPRDARNMNRDPRDPRLGDGAASPRDQRYGDPITRDKGYRNERDPRDQGYGDYESRDGGDRNSVGLRNGNDSRDWKAPGDKRNVEARDPGGDRYGDARDPGGDRYGDARDPGGDRYGDARDPRGDRYGDARDPGGDRYGDARDPGGDRYGDARDPGGDRYGDARDPGGDRYGDARDPGGDRYGDARDPGGDRYGDARDPRKDKSPRDSVITDSGDPRGQGYQDPRGQGYQDPRGQGYKDPRGQGYQDPRGQGYKDPRGQAPKNGELGSPRESERGRGSWDPRRDRVGDASQATWRDSYDGRRGQIGAADPGAPPRRGVEGGPYREDSMRGQGSAETYSRPLRRDNSITDPSFDSTKILDQSFSSSQQLPMDGTMDSLLQSRASLVAEWAGPGPGPQPQPLQGVGRNDSLRTLQEWTRQQMQKGRPGSQYSSSSDKPLSDGPRRYGGGTRPLSDASPSPGRHANGGAPPGQGSGSGGSRLPRLDLSLDPQGPQAVSSAAVLDASGPSRPPLPADVRDRYIRDLADTKTPHGRQDLLNAAEISKARLHEPLVFQYPSVGSGSDRLSQQNGSQPGSREFDPMANQRKPQKQGWAERAPGPYGKGPGPRDMVPRGAPIDTIKEDPDMTDGDIIATKTFADLQKHLNGVRLRLSISAADLVGKSHEELVLLLIQLRRFQSRLEKIRDIYRSKKDTTRPTEKEYKLRRRSSIGRLEDAAEREHEQFIENQKACDELEKQLEVIRPMVNLLDNMVRMGSLYGGDNLLLVSQYKRHQLPAGVTQPAKKMIEFSRQHQEEKMSKDQELELKQLMEDEVDLEEKLQQLYSLDSELQDKSTAVTSLRERKGMLDQALEGVKRDEGVERDPRRLDWLREQRNHLEHEMTICRQQLADSSRRLEETSAEIAKVENEVILLRKRIYALNRSQSSTALANDQWRSRQKLETELDSIQSVMTNLNHQGAKLSDVMKTLRHSTPDLTADAAKERKGSYMETDLDTLHSRDLGLGVPGRGGREAGALSSKTPADTTKTYVVRDMPPDRTPPGRERSNSAPPPQDRSPVSPRSPDSPGGHLSRSQVEYRSLRRDPYPEDARGYQGSGDSRNHREDRPDGGYHGNGPDRQNVPYQYQGDAYDGDRGPPRMNQGLHEDRHPQLGSREAPPHVDQQRVVSVTRTMTTQGYPAHGGGSQPQPRPGGYGTGRPVAPRPPERGQSLGWGRQDTPWYPGQDNPQLGSPNSNLSDDRAASDASFQRDISEADENTKRFYAFQRSRSLPRMSTGQGEGYAPLGGPGDGQLPGRTGSLRPFIPATRRDGQPQQSASARLFPAHKSGAPSTQANRQYDQLSPTSSSSSSQQRGRPYGAPSVELRSNQVTVARVQPVLSSTSAAYNAAQRPPGVPRRSGLVRPLSVEAGSGLMAEYARKNVGVGGGERVGENPGEYWADRAYRRGQPRSRFMTISSSRPLEMERSPRKQPLHDRQTAAGDLISGVWRDNVPDLTRYENPVKETEFDIRTIEREVLFVPEKVDIPERYLPDSDDDDSVAESLRRQQKSDQIKRLLAAQSLQEWSKEEIRWRPGVRRQVEDEMKRREHILDLKQSLAREVTQKSKQVAESRLWDQEHDAPRVAPSFGRERRRSDLWLALGPDNELLAPDVRSELVSLERLTLSAVAGVMEAEVPERPPPPRTLYQTPRDIRMEAVVGR